MLIVLLFLVLLAAKLAAIGLVSQIGPLVALPIIAACYLIARRVDATAARQG